MNEDNKSIPVIENERRFYPHPDRRKGCLKEHFPKEINRRNENDRRQSRGVSKSALEQVTDILRDEQRSLISFIADKENKKQQVFRFQLTAIAILATAIVTVLPLFEQFIMRQGLDGGVNEIIFDDYLKEKIFLTLIVFNVIGLIVISLVNLTSAAVIKQITSLKSNILLAVRQLNCNREAIQDAIAEIYVVFILLKTGEKLRKVSGA